MIGSVRFVVDKRDSYEHGNVSQQEAAELRGWGGDI